MGNEDYIIKIHEILGEVSTDIKWLKSSREADVAETKEYFSRKRTFRTYAAAIGIPLLVSAAVSVGVFAAHMTKNVDILCALHKPQMAIFESGGRTVVDPYMEPHIVPRSK